VSQATLKANSSRTNALPALPFLRIGIDSPFLVSCQSLLVTKLATRYSLLVTAKRSGFTLLEILVAMAILGIVIATVLGSFNMVFSTTERLDSGADLFEAGKNTLGRIAADLENIFILDRPPYQPPGPSDPPDPYRFLGTVDAADGTRFATLRVSSRAHVPLEPGRQEEGIAQIVYYVQVRRDGAAVLRRADHLYPYPQFEANSRDPVVAENVKSLAFTFIAEEGSETDTWDSDDARYGYATPAVVRVRLELAGGEETAVFQTAVRLPRLRRPQS
jgi:general secretion pathway protein J